MELLHRLRVGECALTMIESIPVLEEAANRFQISAFALTRRRHREAFLDRSGTES